MGQIAENRHDVILRGHIKIAGRLIGQNNPRPIAQRPRNGDALLLTAGQVQDTFLGILLRQSNLPQQFQHDLMLRPIERHPGRLHGQHDVLLHGERGKQVEALENHADVMAPETVPVEFGEIPAVVHHPPLGGQRQSRQERQHGRLARARRPGDGDQFARPEVMAQIVDDFLAAIRIRIGDVVEREDCSVRGARIARIVRIVRIIRIVRIVRRIRIERATRIARITRDGFDHGFGRKSGRISWFRHCRFGLVGHIRSFHKRS